ncbi:MAG TPA: hypothetical protein DCE18_00840 [Syntrophobacteraceae bacterium]|jgi:hypothetical protein|nr:hypothetical protein [Syntrophobacteraceae bacterium]
MRCQIGPRKVKKYSDVTGLPIAAALVRGNTDHRIDMFLIDGTLVCWFKDGNIVRYEDGVMLKTITHPVMGRKNIGKSLLDHGPTAHPQPLPEGIQIKGALPCEAP